MDLNAQKGFFERAQGENWVIEFTSLCSWEEFQMIAETIEKYENATILQRYDGPDARRWIIEIDSVRLELYHDDMGINWLVAPLSYKESARRICEEVVSSLNHSKS